MIDNKSERILDAAFEKFRQYGFLKTTVEEIARYAQVGKGTIYFYFKSKEEILNGLLDRELKKGYTEVANALIEEHTAAGKLSKLFKTIFDFFLKNEFMSKVVAMDQQFVLSLITDKNKELQNLSITAIKTILEQGHKDGTLREVDYEKVAYILDSIIRSFHYLYYLGLDVHKTHDILDSLTDLISLGLTER